MADPTPSKPKKPEDDDRLTGALVGVGTSLLGPLVAKGLGSMFGLDEASPEERKAAADREAVLQKLRDAAEGKTASAAQLQAQQQQQRTIQALSSMAARGTAQQQAGAQRAAMQAAPEVMAQQGATAAMARAAEMTAARRDLGAMQLQASQQQAAEGMANRKYMQGLIGAGVSGAAAAGAAAMTQSPAPKKPAAPPPPPPPPPGGGSTGTTASALTAAPVQYADVAPVQHVGQAELPQSSATSFARTAPPSPMAVDSSPASGLNFGGSLKSPTLQLGKRSRNALYGVPESADVFAAKTGLTMPKIGRGY